MDEGSEPSKTLRFGVFEVDLRAGELRRSGLKVRLQEQPFRVLGMLLARPGKVVMREELQKKLWPGDTFVDFDNGLNTAINKIRDALGDSAEAPRYVETLPRRGYRFIAPVEVAAAEPAVRLTSRAVAAGSSSQSDSGVRRLPRRALPWVLAAVATIAAVVLALVATYMVRKPRQNEGVIQFSLFPPEGTIYGGFALSPDGKQLAFVGVGKDGTRQLWVRALNSPVPRIIKGTDGAVSPFWSPDSRYVAFYAGGSLKKIDLLGGPLQTLCEVHEIVRGGSWNGDGTILFARPVSGEISKVSDEGGIPSPATKAIAKGEGWFVYPQFLPDGQHFLYYNYNYPRAVARAVFVGNLGSKEGRQILSANSPAFYSPPGYLLFLQGTTLVAQRFKLAQQSVTGDAWPVLAGVGSFSVSQAGSLAYIGARSTLARSRLTWFDRNGKELGTVGHPDIYTNPALSPDGTKLAVGVGDLGHRDIWVFDLQRDTASRLTFNPADDVNPAWSPDGSRILFTSTRNGQRDLFEKAADGLGSTVPVFQSKDQQKSVIDWSSEGHYVLYGTLSHPNSLWILPLLGPRKPFQLVQGPYGSTQGQFSPNNHYVAYTSNATGAAEVYVQTFPKPSGKWQISTNGGMDPFWRADGRELFYLKGDELIAVDVDTDPGAFHASTPRPLFTKRILPNKDQFGDLYVFRNRYVASPNGKKFLMLKTVLESTIAPAHSPITVVINWPALLKKP